MNGPRIVALTPVGRASDRQGAAQPPVAEFIPLGVGQRPQQHHHYYGPHIGGDGVIILRGGTGGERQVLVATEW